MALPLLDGAVLGFSIALPFGPVSLICVQRSLHAGALQGIVSGCGAALAHGLFFAASMLAAASLLQMGWFIRPLSAVVLVAMGIRALLRRPRTGQPVPHLCTRAAMGSALMLALSNPLTIVPYMAAGPAIAAAGRVMWMGASLAVLGAITGSAAYYAVLSSGAGLLRGHLTPAALRPLNLLGGLLLIGFGLRLGFS